MNFAWPTAEVAVMGAKGAVEIIFRGQDIGAKASERTLVYDDYQDGCVCVWWGV